MHDLQRQITDGQQRILHRGAEVSTLLHPQHGRGTVRNVEGPREINRHDAVLAAVRSCLWFQAEHHWRFGASYGHAPRLRLRVVTKTSERTFWQDPVPAATQMDRARVRFQLAHEAVQVFRVIDLQHDGSPNAVLHYLRDEKNAFDPMPAYDARLYMLWNDGQLLFEFVAEPCGGADETALLNQGCEFWPSEGCEQLRARRRWAGEFCLADVADSLPRVHIVIIRVRRLRAEHHSLPHPQALEMHVLLPTCAPAR
mmetsp:Transcript_118371/g.334515  ORF Transcript_118371/g.334515 Transcript_118371/m.334515 type:complete len:255 (-) Transcript_118371:227-991(-)